MSGHVRTVADAADKTRLQLSKAMSLRLLLKQVLSLLIMLPITERLMFSGQLEQMRVYMLLEMCRSTLQMGTEKHDKAD